MNKIYYNLIKKIYNNIIQNMHVVKNKNKNKKIFIYKIFLNIFIPT